MIKKNVFTNLDFSTEGDGVKITEDHSHAIHEPKILNLNPLNSLFKNIC